jgi:hypothetical protein
MQKRPEQDWVAYVLRDVVIFLAENDMIQSAQMLAVAAAHIDHDMRRKSPARQKAHTPEKKIITFPGSKSVLN